IEWALNTIRIFDITPLPERKSFKYHPLAHESTEGMFQQGVAERLPDAIKRGFCRETVMEASDD
ncbi:hypothetical protein TNIN_268561, partial [Trichonephila inaurata madagascariensis]